MLIHGDVIRFGVHSGQQYTSFEELAALWRRAEDLGFDWVSLFDHFRPPLGGPAGPCFEGTTALAALATGTSRIRCAILVSALTWRHPALAAAVAATLDHICGGRLEFGVGAGGPDLAYAQYGIAFPPAHQRLAMLDEACQVMRGLWDNERTSFAGRHFQLTDAYLAPKPLQRRLPLVIGGEGEKLLGVVARHADVWNMLAGPAYPGKVEALERHCAAAGRDPGSVRRSITFRALLARTPGEAADRREALLRGVPPDWPVLGEYLTFGTPEQCVADLLPYVRLGVRDFILGARPPVDWQTVELVATEVAPAIRASLP